MLISGHELLFRGYPRTQAVSYPPDTSYVLPPPSKLLIRRTFILALSYDLKDGKKSPVRARLRAGGKRASKRWRSPAFGRAGEFLLA